MYYLDKVTFRVLQGIGFFLCSHMFREQYQKLGIKVPKLSRRVGCSNVSSISLCQRGAEILHLTGVNALLDQ